MKAELILYSRSKYKDYRWIFTPKNISHSQLEKITTIYHSLNDYPELLTDEYPPLISICLDDSWLIFFICITDNTDVNGRRVYSLQGFSFAKKYWRDVRYYLPVIIDNYKEKLSTYNFISYSQTEEISSKHKSIVFDIKNKFTFPKRLIKFINNSNSSSNNESKRLYPTEIINLLQFIYGQERSIYEFACRDLNICENIHKGVTSFNDSSYVKSTKNQEFPNISNQNIEAEEKEVSIPIENDLNNYEYCQIYLEEKTCSDIDNMIFKAFRSIMNDKSLNNKYAIVVKNNSTNNTLLCRQLPITISLENIEDYNINDKSIIGMLSEIEAIREKLHKHGWKEEKKEKRNDPWWAFSFYKEKAH